MLRCCLRKHLKYTLRITFHRYYWLFFLLLQPSQFFILPRLLAHSHWQLVNFSVHSEQFDFVTVVCLCVTKKKIETTNDCAQKKKCHFMQLNIQTTAEPSRAEPAFKLLHTNYQFVVTSTFWFIHHWLSVIQTLYDVYIREVLEHLDIGALISFLIHIEHSNL